MRFLKTKFQQDVGWNALTFISLGISGVTINLLIVGMYGTEILGAFNQVYAIYILASQLAVFGFYASVLKFISQYAEDKEECDKIMTGAIFAVAVFGAIASFLFWALAPVAGKILESEAVVRGMRVSYAALWFFALNKIFLSFLNGKRFMKPFALFYGFRYLSLPFFLLFMIFAGMRGESVPLIFVFTEALLFIGLFVYTYNYFSFAPLRASCGWLKTHLPFGFKSFWGGSMVELNSRVDIVMLGLFLSDKLVGIYSFASLFAEGAMQISTIFRVNYNPIITRFVVEKKIGELSQMIKSFLRRWILPAMFIFASAIVIFPLIGGLFLESADLMLSWSVFAILMIGVAIKSGYDVFWEMPSQAGFPGWQTFLISAIAVSNIILNYILISQFGVYGAAAELIISSILGIIILKMIVRKIMGIKI